MHREEIYRSDEYAVDFQMAGGSASETVVITFTEFGHNTLEGPGFGSNFLLKYGFDVVAVRSKNDTWYSDFSPHVFDLINEFLAGRGHLQRATYGSSMGAYAALTFAKSLLADRAFAISPQFDISMPEDTRWARYATNPMRKMRRADVSETCTYVLLYDPREPDAMQCGRFQAIIPTAQRIDIKIPFSGHPTGRALSEVGLLVPLARQILAGDFNIADHRALAKAARASAISAFHYSLKLNKSKKFKWAREMIGRSLERDPLHPEYRIHAAKVCAAMKLHEEAVTHASVAACLAPTNPWIIAHLAEILASQGLRSQALHHFRTAVGLFDEPFWRARIAQLGG